MYKRLRKFTVKNILIVFLIICCAFAFRFYKLSERPMHTDEAVHGIKFGILLESGQYTYDPFDYHGPSLNYLTLIPSWLHSVKNINDVNELMLRSIPSIIGFLLVCVFLFFKNSIRTPISMIIALLIALSPAMVFYSRYYIQEILLVFFTFGFIYFLYRLFFFGKKANALFAGVFLGFMTITKETWIVYSFMIVFIMLFVILISDSKSKKGLFKRISTQWLIITFLVLPAAIIFVLFYSALFQNLQGITDAISPFFQYIDRASGNSAHVYPFLYYFKLILSPETKWGIVSGEAIIFILGLTGIFIIGYLYVSGKKKSLINYGDYRLFLFFAIYTVVSMLFFSLIPYKTPWNMLGFWHGIIINAGFSIYYILCNSGRVLKYFWIVVLGISLIQLIGQSVEYNFKKYDSPNNPYVYSQPQVKIHELISDVQAIIQCHPMNKQLPVTIYYPGSDYWPLPWYLRRYNNISWRNSVDNLAPSDLLVLAPVKLESELLNKWYTIPKPGEKHLYIPLNKEYELRPNVKIYCYLRKDLWDMCQSGNLKCLESNQTE